MRILRSIAGILAAVMFMLSAVSGLSFADDAIDTSDVIDPEMGLVYHLMINNKYVVEVATDYADNLPNDLVIPSEYNGKPVVGIGGFKNCANLTSVVLPDTIESIMDYAFSGCNGLKSIYIPKSVYSISGYTFFGCENFTSITVDEDNAHYSSEDGVLYNKNKTELVEFPYGKNADNYQIPKSVTEICNGVFEGHEELVSIELHEGITTIGWRAFQGCTNLEHIEIPESVTEMRELVFGDCVGLTSVTLSKGLDRINDSMFYNCKNLISVVIPDTVTLISEGVFMGCEKLTSIDIPDEVWYIGASAFRGTGLTSVKIPNKVTYLQYNTFRDCMELKSVTLPSNIETIREGVFSGTNIEDVYYEGTESQWREIEIQEGNSVLETATIHYNSAGFDDKEPDNTDPGEKDPSDPDNSGSNKPTPSVPSNTDNSDSNTQTPEEPDVDKPVTPPALDKGEFDKNTVWGDGVVGAEIVTPLGSLMNAVLTDEEREMLENGIDIGVVLDINSANSSVSETDRRVAEDALSGLGYTAGLYLDVKLFKTIGDEQSQIDTTYEPITLSFEIPKDLRKTDRKYVMVRVHNGVTDVLNDYDDNENTITIRTDKFSTYVLAYYDEPSSSVTPSDGNDSSNDNPYTNGDSHAKFYFTAGIASLFVFVMLCLFTGKNGMTEEQKEQKFSKLIAWGKRGGKVRAAIALTVIFLLLSFYYGIGMKRPVK